MGTHAETRDAGLAAEADGAGTPVVAFDARKWLALRAPLAARPEAPPSGQEQILARRRIVETWLLRRPAGVG